MTWLWLAGDSIQVRSNALGTPQTIIWQGKSHRVTRVIRRWRIDIDWWRGRIWREYFKLVTRTSLLVEIYHDLSGGGWFVQRLYD
jgi:hypothetical protein